MSVFSPSPSSSPADRFASAVGSNASGATTSAELWLRRVVKLFAAVAVLGALAHFGLLLWAQNEFSQPESIVGAQSTMLAKHGTWYYGLKNYPYTVTAYMPIFYSLDAGLIRAGVRAFTGARLISYCAYLVLGFLCWRLTLLYTGERDYAWLTATLYLSTSLLLSWGTVGQVDMLAITFSVAAFERFSVYWVRQEPALPAALVLALAALFTKQTTLACPAAILLLLWSRDKKIALQFGAAFAGIAATLLLLMNAALQGHFFANVVFANMNPFAWSKLPQHLQYMAVFSGQLILVVLVCARRTWRGPARALLVYGGLASLMWLITAPKIGSDSNYQIETTALLVVCASVGLHSLGFFQQIFTGSRGWVTLLQVPLALYLILNFRMTVPVLLQRVAREQEFRQQVDALRPFLAGNQRVLSTDMNALLQTGRPIEVEPLIYTLMVNSKRVDPEPVRRDLAQAAFPVVVLYSEAGHPFDDLEIPSLPAPQLREIQDHYDLAAHIPGPYLQGIFVYRLRAGLSTNSLVTR